MKTASSDLSTNKTKTFPGLGIIEAASYNANGHKQHVEL